MESRQKTALQIVIPEGEAPAEPFPGKDLIPICGINTFLRQQQIFPEFWRFRRIILHFNSSLEMPFSAIDKFGEVCYNITINRYRPVYLLNTNNDNFRVKMEVLSENRDFLYKQVQTWLKKQIRAGKLKPGSKLPGERSLAGILKISRGTARIAMQELEKNGFIERIPSRGAFIKEAGEQRQLKLALVFPEVEISREYLSYANWMSNWGRQQGLMTACAKNNAYLSLIHCDEEKSSGPTGKDYVEKVYNRLVNEFDGAFFISSQNLELKKILLKYSYPFINMSEMGLLPGENGMAYNRKEVCKQAAEFLINRGCRKIIMLVQNIKRNITWGIKFNTVKEVFDAAKIPFSASDIFKAGDDENIVYQNLRNSFSNHNNLPDAFFCTTQTHAMALLRLAGEKGWQVPDDFHIIGYGNNPEIVNYPAVREISYIHLPTIEIGQTAGELLIRKILHKKEIPAMTFVKTELVTERAKVFSE